MTHGFTFAVIITTVIELCLSRDRKPVSIYVVATVLSNIALVMPNPPRRNRLVEAVIDGSRELSNPMPQKPVIFIRPQEVRAISLAGTRRNPR
jgi:hypothetical protein